MIQQRRTDPPPDLADAVMTLLYCHDKGEITLEDLAPDQLRAILNDPSQLNDEPHPKTGRIGRSTAAHYVLWRWHHHFGCQVQAAVHQQIWQFRQFFLQAEREAELRATELVDEYGAAEGGRV